MNKKTMSILSIISMAVLIVGVLGASYAYFSASANAGTHTVKVTTPEAQTATIQSSSTLPLTVTGAQMEQLGHNQDYSVSNNADVTLTAYDPGQRFCYTARINYDGSTFSYSPNNTSHNPELKIGVNKKNASNTNYGYSTDITGQKTTSDKYLKVSGSNLALGSSSDVHIITSSIIGSTSDTWTLTITFTNYTNYVQNNNAGKTATAKLILTQANCPPV